MSPSAAAYGPKFAVTVRYGGADRSGSNGNVYLRLGDSTAGVSTGEVAVHLPGDPAELGREETGEIAFDTSLAEVNALEARVDAATSTWTLAAIDWFQIEDLETHALWQSEPVAETEQGFAASVRRERTGSRETVLTRDFALNRLPSARYRITIETGTEPGAGTTANVMVRLLGPTDCHLTWLALNNPNEKVKTGARLRYGPFTYVEHDPPTEVEVRLDEMTVDSDRWQLLRVGIEDIETGRSWVADCDNWFDWTSPQQTFPLVENGVG
ncbi:hypothetical protein HLB23_20125 [Nocardia uniformis]|uniref:PLAT domain-containing protein n=1 Tax=Nocardia uniformis TaxID=53432 RepID=A0A849C319_9NOCA|nr:PLAT/LH2 domain-containing protein [Nocardia uniformis]NNH72138.1 hypothetical protein [Nocardia uniformis]